MIRLADVSKTFHGRHDDIHALAAIDLTVSNSELVAVVGRSGCGKSTLLRLTAGLLAPTTGQVTIDDDPVTKPRRDVSMIFQRPALLPWRTVLDNVLLPAEILGFRAHDYRGRALRLLDMVGIAGFHNRHPYELSGGMQQRAALCRSLLTDPRVMLMDEPFSALDALTREELSVQLQRIHIENAVTIVLVTHSIEEAVLLADRVVVLTPQPGRVNRIIDIDVPRPRTLGRHTHTEDVARVSAELHDLLMPGGEPSPG